MGTNYSAKQVFDAARHTFSQFGNECYADLKSQIFLRRCGADINLRPEQKISKELISRIVFAMLDSVAGKIFWSRIKHSGAA